MKLLVPILVLVCYFTNAQNLKNPSAKIDTAMKTAFLSVTDFGAHAGNFDNADAFQSAFNFIITHPLIGSSLYIPPGNYFESRPWVLKSVVNGKWDFFHIRIFGNASAKSSPDTYLTTITCGFSDGFGIGVQFGRDVEIENIAIVGKYQPPSINIYNIGSTLYSAWTNNTARDSRKAPHCGIAIDPFCDINKIAPEDCYGGMRSEYLLNSGRGGTSGMKITKCRINNFVVGIALSPNGYTQNDEDIDMVDDNIFACKVNIAVCQDQSKDINIDRLKSWGPTYTVLDGIRYGAGTGGGSVNCYRWNIAGTVNQLFNLSTSRFPLSCREIYAESLFRIGNVGFGSGSNFIDCRIDLLTGAGLPATDYVIAGKATFYGGTLRYYDQSYSHRINLNTTTILFRDMTLNNYPITIGLYGLGVNHYPVPKFDNVNWYYNTSSTDTVMQSWPSPSINIDKTNWTANFVIPPKASNMYKVGDYVLGGPTDATRWFYDRDMYGENCNTIQIGRVIRIVNNTVYLDDVGLNAYNGSSYGAIFICRIK